MGQNSRFPLQADFEGAHKEANLWLLQYRPLDQFAGSKNIIPAKTRLLPREDIWKHGGFSFGFP